MMATTYAVCAEVDEQTGPRLVLCLSAAFRGRFVYSNGNINWSPAPGLGGYTLERIHAFVVGFFLGRL
jgi:hypothetical protein